MLPSGRSVFFNILISVEVRNIRCVQLWYSHPFRAHFLFHEFLCCCNKKDSTELIRTETKLERLHNIIKISSWEFYGVLRLSTGCGQHARHRAILAIHMTWSVFRIYIWSVYACCVDSDLKSTTPPQPLKVLCISELNWLLDLKESVYRVQSSGLYALCR